MEIGKRIATRILSDFGFQVEEILETTCKRADLRATDGECSLVVEAKDKLEDQRRAQERVECLSRGEVYPNEDPLSHDNTIQGVLRDARDQLDKTPKDADTLQLIWFHASGVDSDLKYRQAFATFYGHVHLRPMYPHKVKDTECFYFDYNAAFDMPTVDALILTELKSRNDVQIQMCVNEFAPRAPKFRATRFYREALSRNWTIDPVAWEESGRSISLRSSVSRKHDPDICGALQQQTGVLYNPIRLTRYTSTVAVRP